MRFADRALAMGLALNGDGQGAGHHAASRSRTSTPTGRPGRLQPATSRTTRTLSRVSLPGPAAWEDRTRQYNLGAVSRPFLGWATGFHDFRPGRRRGPGRLPTGTFYPTATSRHPWTRPIARRRSVRARGGTVRACVDAARRRAWLAEAHVGFAARPSGDSRPGTATWTSWWRSAAGCPRAQNDGARAVPGGLLADRRPGIGNRHGVRQQGRASLGRRQVQTRWIVGGGSFQASSAPVAYFGLAGSGDASLEVTWSDGTVQKVERAGPGAVDRRAPLAVFFRARGAGVECGAMHSSSPGGARFGRQRLHARAGRGGVASGTRAAASCTRRRVVLAREVEGSAPSPTARRAARPSWRRTTWSSSSSGYPPVRDLLTANLPSRRRSTSTRSAFSARR